MADLEELFGYLSDRKIEVSAPMIQAELGWSLDQIMRVGNALLEMRRVELFQKAGELCFRAINSEAASILASLSQEERIVYKLIENAGSNGIWSGDLKYHSNMLPAILTKTLKGLEKKKLIKAVKTVNNKTRRVYMLMNTEPARSLTGGPWYTENELDAEFISVLAGAALNFISSRTMVTLQEIHQNITDRHISTVQLSEEDVQTLVNTLVYDGKVEEMEVQRVGLGLGPGKTYRKNRMSPPTNHFPNIPCSTCPVFAECCDDGVINPRQCEFLARWSKLF
eukprot:TRINITY_DN12866_c0_g1_i1.p1 TRINITY_DN12866_c0_g1~~TRINITY_DN12866_c0_g1_i1.p1  ORF type:complete len:292 (-),score=36.35 TRINITY_DN12866_c0_g1_i1:18-860(-)